MLCFVWTRYLNYYHDMYNNHVCTHVNTLPPMRTSDTTYIPVTHAHAGSKVIAILLLLLPTSVATILHVSCKGYVSTLQVLLARPSIYQIS